MNIIRVNFKKEKARRRRAERRSLFPFFGNVFVWVVLVGLSVYFLALVGLAAAFFLM